MNISRNSQRPGFIEGAVVALVASLIISFSVSVFDWLLPVGLLLRIVISLAGFAYLLYLFSRSREKLGRLTALSVYIVMAVVTWIFLPSLPWVVIAHLLMIWLIRSLYFYSSVLSALLDLGLTALSVVAAVAAYLHSGSLFLGLWSLFLMQALFTWIPSDWQGRSASKQSTIKTDHFDNAHRAAERAVRQLANGTTT